MAKRQQPKLIEYVAYYSHIGPKGSGTGNVDIQANTPIKSVDEIRKIEQRICDKFGFHSVVIVNIQRLPI